MTAVTPRPTAPAFYHGIQYFGEPSPEFEQYGKTPIISEHQIAIANPTAPTAVYQTLLAADALRYLTLQTTASKASGHPGGFASIADGVAALIMLGYKNILTEVGHHAPGFYSTMFLDRSLEDMGIETVQDMGDRFRETHGLLGHLSGQIPGLLNPAGPLGQGQHFAMAGAKLHPRPVISRHHRRWRLGRTLYHEQFGPLQHRLPQCHQLSAYPGLEWVLPGTPQHGVH